jgi:hypothetical protein
VRRPGRSRRGAAAQGTRDRLSQPVRQRRGAIRNREDYNAGIGGPIISITAVAKLFAVANLPAKEVQSLPPPMPVRAFQFLFHIFLNNSPDGGRQLGRQNHSLDCVARKAGAFMFCIEGSPRGASRKTQHLGLRTHRVITSSDQGRFERFDLARLPCLCREMLWGWRSRFAPTAFWLRTRLYSRELAPEFSKNVSIATPGSG